MAKSHDSKEFDPFAQRQERVYAHDIRFDKREMQDHLTKSSAAQLAICLAASAKGSPVELLEERLKGKEVELDDDLADVLTEAERKLLPVASYIIEGLQEVVNIEGSDAYRAAKNAVSIHASGLDRLP